MAFGHAVQAPGKLAAERLARKAAQGFFLQGAFGGAGHAVVIGGKGAPPFAEQQGGGEAALFKGGGQQVQDHAVRQLHGAALKRHAFGRGEVGALVGRKRRGMVRFRQVGEGDGSVRHATPRRGGGTARPCLDDGLPGPVAQVAQGGRARHVQQAIARGPALAEGGLHVGPGG